MIVCVKGLIEWWVLYGYVFCNVMLIVIVGFLVMFLGVFFGVLILIEIIFLLDGLGWLGFEVVV